MEDLSAVGESLEALLGVADKGELREYQVRGRIALAQADLDAALEALEDARGRAEAIGGRLIMWRADSALGDVHRIAGRSAEADAAYCRAWETLQDMAATLASEEARESLLTSPSAAELRAKVEMGD